MNCNFDFFGRYEQPELILCNPDDSEIGIITNAEDLSPDICLSDISSISYKIYETDNPEYNSSIYDKHIERRQVKVVGTGFFIITSSSEFVDETGKYKQIEAKSCEYELNNVAMPYVNGTYQLYKPENFSPKDNEEIAQQDDEYLNENCILYEIMKVIPSWTLVGQAELIGDGAKHSAEMKEKYKALGEAFRTFEYSDTTVYSFLTNELQDSYDCFVYFNIEEREIQILHKEDVFEVLPMVISEANILNSCEVSTTIDSYVNALNVEGAAGVNIASVNPLGNSMVYNFDHDISIGLIDGELKELLEYWKSSIENAYMYDGICYPSNVVQKWLNAPSKISDYKFKLIDEVGKGENGDISEVLNDPKFLSDIGLPDNEIVEFKRELLETVANILASSDQNDSEINTGAIENIFFRINRYRINILEHLNISEYMSVQELNRLLYSAQELEMGIKSEIDSLKSYKKGYDAQYEALSVTATDNSEDANRALTEQLNIVDGYRVIIEDSTTQYATLLESVESITSDIDGILVDLFKRNSFEGRFAEYYQNLGYGIEDSKDKAFEMYKALTRYIKQQTYTDETIVITEAMGIDEKFTQEFDLYNSSISLLEKISIPEYEITVAAESFLFSREYEEVISSLGIRSAVYVEIPNGDVPLFHLLKISINYDEQSCELTFGNRIRLSDPTSVFSDLQRTVSSASNIVAAERIEWGISEEKINELMVQKNSDIDTTFRMMSNSVNKTTMGNDGFKCYAVDANGMQDYGMWCANGVMMFVDKDKDTGAMRPQMAIGRMLKSDGSTAYGFHGQSIIANTITTDKLIAGALSKGTNYIRNGSFESLDNYWNIQGECWCKNMRSAPVGQRALELGSGSYASQDLANTPVNIASGTYVLSFYYRNGHGDVYSPISGLSVSLYNDGNVVDKCDSLDNFEIVSVCWKESSNTMLNSLWGRCYKVINISSPIPSPVICIENYSDDYVVVDGVMFEKASSINDYIPHITETYSKYTTIDDSGVTVYNGKIKILNNEGVSVFSADDLGNLTLTGVINAKSGGNIAGWYIGEDEIYRDSTATGGGIMRLSSLSSNKIFSYTNSNEEETFYVDKEGNLYISNELVATNAKITGTIEADDGYIGAWTIDGISLDNNNQGELVLRNGLYTTKFDGYGIYGGKNDSWGMSVTMAPSSGSADGTWSGAIKGAFTDANVSYDNLALAGREEIFFGLRPNNSYKEAGKIYWNVGVFNEYPIFKIEAIQAKRIVIDGVVYYINAFTDTRLSSLSNPLGRYLGLTTLY